MDRGGGDGNALYQTNSPLEMPVEPLIFSAEDEALVKDLAVLENVDLLKGPRPVRRERRGPAREGPPAPAVIRR